MTHPEPRSAHPGVEQAHQHVSLITRGQVGTLAGPNWFPDVSEFNGPVDWDALGAAYRAGQVSAVAIRAGFGTVRADRQFGANQAGARAQGIPAVYYWFCYPAYNLPSAEAGLFNYVVGPLLPGEAQAADFEDDPGANPFPRGQAGLDWARAFLTALAAPQNATWWYTYPFLLGAVGLQPLIGAWPFWLADYSATPDSAFGSIIARQFTDCGSTPGVGGCCDQSRVLQAPLSQWLTGGEGEDMTPEQDQRLADVLYLLLFGAAPRFADPAQNPMGWTTPDGKGHLTRAAEVLAANDGAILADLGVEKSEIDAMLAAVKAPAAIDAGAVATALATHPLTATLNDAERDEIAAHVLTHLAKDAAAG